jgi:hypothetical protein
MPPRALVAVIRIAYDLPFRVAEVASRALDVVVFAFTSERFVDALTRAFYDRRNVYLSDAHNLSGFSTSERRCVEQWFPAGGRVLVTSAGAGREAIAFVERGWSVVATDTARIPAEEMARRLGSAAEVHCLPPDEVPHGNVFDAAVIGFGAYSHLQGRERRIAFLRRLRATMAPRAPLLVSYLAVPAFRRLDRIVAAAAKLFRSPLRRRLIEPGERIQSACYFRFFVTSEVIGELREAGFEVVHEESTVYGYVVARPQ